MIRSKPMVSIITGTYNSSPYLNNFMRSMESQTFPDFECIFVDDGSKDETVSKLEQICAHDPRFRLIQKTPEGNPALSRNAGINAARGNYIAFCDHDDYWAPEKLEFQMRAFGQYPSAAIVHTNRIVKRDLMAVQRFPKLTFNADNLIHQDPYQGLYFGCNITHSSVMVRAELLHNVKGMNPKLKGVDDYHLFLKLSLHGPIILIAEPLTYYYWHEKNLSHVDRLFIDGLYLMAEEMRQEGLPDWLTAYIQAQALKSDAVSRLMEDPWRALGLTLKSTMHKKLPRSMALLGLAFGLGLMPQFVRKLIEPRLRRYRQSPLLRSV